MCTLHAVLTIALLAPAAQPPTGTAPPAQTPPTAYDPSARPTEAAPPVEVAIHDDDRARDVLLTIRRPAQTPDAPAPLVIFSHGAGGSGEAFTQLSETLASRGYVVVHPWHSDSIKLARRNGEPGYDRTRGPEQLVDRVDLRDRLADVRFIIDHVADLEAELASPGLIDPERIGMAGHSAGAMTTQTAGGLRLFPRGRGRGMAMPVEQIDAFAIISGQGTTRRAITDASWSACDKPWLVVAGSEDRSPASDETPEGRRHPYQFAPADGTKHELFIVGATHSAYQGKDASRRLREATPDNVDWIERVTTMTVVAHMDAYVKNDPAAKAWLDSDAVTEIEGGELEWRRK